MLRKGMVNCLFMYRIICVSIGGATWTDCDRAGVGKEKYKEAGEKKNPDGMVSRGVSSNLMTPGAKWTSAPR